MAQEIGTQDFLWGLFDYVQYSDASYRYHCRAMPLTPLAASSWIICREALDGTRVEFLSRRPEFPATSLAVVQALFA
jgi:hypothetical protein